MDSNHPEVTHGLKKSERPIKRAMHFPDHRTHEQRIARMHRELLRRVEKEVAHLNKNSSTSRIKRVRQSLIKEFGNRIKTIHQSIRNQFQTIRNRN
jgi:Zn-dependent oligopeptidase